ncbi:MAG: tRNA (guanosine(37)-N1)-methyltransferase TrmD [Pseudomonadales bacterium]|nr:tRNA (guanosine(37)-N1)-methyltransferase TrmD [Pseudomonadales bacterium]
MWIGIVTLFPEMFRAITDFGITGRACREGLINLEYWNPRNFAGDRHRTVDDRPYGGGPGMLMKTGPLGDAIVAARSGRPGARVIYLSPQGRRLDQRGVEVLAASKELILLCGRYEGIDERVLEAHVDEEWSIGDFVISGGELAAMVLVDAVTRLQPGALGHEDSAAHDSFAQGLLDHPHYTRPETFAGRTVPAILLSGDHAAIAKWRLKQSLGRTWLRRPELLVSAELDSSRRRLLEEFIEEHEEGSAK